MAYCVYLQAIGLYGIPEVRDDYSLWLDTYYGGTRLSYATNIFFSNGNLDPWYPAGVTPQKLAAMAHPPDSSIVARVIDQGGHHLDLFFPTDQDPQSVREVRLLEEDSIRKWISYRH